MKRRHLFALIGLALNTVAFAKESNTLTLGHHQLDLVLTNPSHYRLLRSQNSHTTTALGGFIFVSAQRHDVATAADLTRRRIALRDQAILGRDQAQAYEFIRAGADITDEIEQLVTAPEFGWSDIWQRYAPWLVGIAILVALLVAAAVSLVFLNRRVHGTIDKLRASEQALRASYTSLQRSEHFLSQSQAIAHLGSWELDLVNNRLCWTDEVYRIFGLSPQQFPATYEAFLEAVHPDDRALVNDAYTTSVERGQDTYDIEHRIVRHSTGEVRYVHERCQHYRDNTGNIVRSIGMVHDITTQRLTIEDRKRHEEQFRAVIDASPIPKAINDNNQNITYLNDAFIKTFGYDRTDIPTLADWWQKAYPKTEYREWVAATWMKRVEKTKQENNPFEPMEVDICCKNGMTRTVVASAAPLGDSHAGSHMVILYDITYRKRIEAEREKLHAQLLQSQKMESIGHLTGGIAHDFNNMLGAILGYAELIQHINPATGPAHDRLEKYVREIFAAGGRAKELISQMLIFSRLSPETDSAEAPVTLLQPIVKEVVKLLRSSIPRTIEVNALIDSPELRARIRPIHLHQILLNLAINSRDAIEGYGHIDIRVRELPDSGVCSACHSAFNGEHVAISVGDNGSGIQEHVRHRIFDPFFTTKDINKGTGMGLSVVHGIVHAVGGHITVSSESGRGTEVKVLLPAITPQQTTANVRVKIKPSHRTLSGRRIMVVDDEPTIGAMLNDFLSIHDGDVSVYNLPLEALAAFTQNPHGVDLVITDETMPGLSGLDMAKSMLAIRPDLPVILCTGYSDRVDAEIARKNGIAAFMTKPLELTQLLHFIEDALK